jgi:hypothetical protein
VEWYFLTKVLPPMHRAAGGICIHIAWSVDLSGACVVRLFSTIRHLEDLWLLVRVGKCGCGAGQFFAEGSTTTFSS